MKSNRKVIVTGIFLLSLTLSACGGDTPTPTPNVTTLVPAPTATTAAADATSTTEVSTATPVAEAPTATTVVAEATATQTTAAESTPTTGASATASTSEDTTPKIVAATNAFLATLSSTEKDTVSFDWSDDAQKARWSNFPPAGFTRAGLMWGDMSEASRTAWLAVMQATLSTEGYNRVIAEWNADQALYEAEGTGGGFGTDHYYIAIIGVPSETDPWQWQWGGHHVTVNATVVGPNISLTPSFIGAQPSTYTDSSGNTVRPLGDIEDEAYALVNSLDATQQKAAILGSTAIDLVLGPGQDGKTIPSEGIPASQLTADQKAALLQLIGHYAGLANAEDSASRMAEIESTLDQTYFAWYGPTTAGSAIYFRITGPTVVIEYSVQNGGNHIHGIYRDPTNDYGAKYTQ